MKTLNILFISLLFFTQAFSQNPKSVSNPDSLAVSFTPSLHENKSNIQAPFINKIHLSLQTGMSFYSIGKQSIFDKWIAPGMTYNFTSKLHFTVGAVASFSNFNGFQSKLNNNEGIKTYTPNANGQYFLFAQGEYLLSNRITIRGSILKEVPNSNPINPSALSISRIGFDIKVSDKFSISADCMIRRNNNSYFMKNYSELYNTSFPFSGNSFNGIW